MGKKIVFGFVVLFSINVLADSLVPYDDGKLDKDEQKALQQTVDLLKNDTKRGMYIHETQGAAKATDQNIDSLTGGNAQNKQKIYELSAKIFDRMVKNKNGDMAPIKQMLINAQQNPEGFAEGLSSEEKALLKEISRDIEKRQERIPAQQ
ncbi:MAG: hypothetical protein KDD50_06625 [Bdellovibrionales bacterium]|nr:hypothetical protein [Bdellovibrionales bacterium]